MNEIEIAPMPIVRRPGVEPSFPAIASANLSGAAKMWMRLKMRMRIYWVALRAYENVALANKAIRALMRNRKRMFESTAHSKLVWINNKLHFHLYAPGFPSPLFDAFIQGELHKLVPIKKHSNPLTFIFMAVTSKCPMQCAHCFEWNNLNQPESLSEETLQQLIDYYWQQGISQFHLGGGEPMVRIKLLEKLIEKNRGKGEFYVLTSGFNCSRENLIRLKQAGLTGLVVSLDDFDEARHNAFRGNDDIYRMALQAMRIANELQLVVTATICATNEFTSKDNLMEYAKLTGANGAHFIQVLEPRMAGRWETSAVSLRKENISLLEDFYFQLNGNLAFKDLPVVIYHGLNQRRMGCSGGGFRFHTIDSAGYVHACPFCQTKNFHVNELLAGKKHLKDVRETGCPI